MLAELTGYIEWWNTTYNQWNPIRQMKSEELITHKDNLLKNLNKAWEKAQSDSRENTAYKEQFKNWAATSIQSLWKSRRQDQKANYKTFRLQPPPLPPPVGFKIFVFR